MTQKQFTLFELSWEVCNKVGGIHTVLSTKAKTLVETLGDDYVVVGPWLLNDKEAPFDEDPEFAAFSETCRELGVPVRVGRWRIPGRPRTILVEFSQLFDQKDGVLSGLWEDYGVDSISGEWDYTEPVLFGHAAALVLERYWEEYVAPQRRRAIVHANEWMTGSALLQLKKRVPSMGTVFTTHATMLGRALSSMGQSPDDGLGDQTPEGLAETHNVVAKHSLEGVCAREADAFTTVSEITAKEAELLHGRAPYPVLPNGIDLDVIDEIAGGTTRQEARTLLQQTASRFLGEDVSDAAFLAVSGRYEFHNKGMNLLLDSLAQLETLPGRRVVLFVLVPAGHSGIKSQLLERIQNPEGEYSDALGISTHNLFDEENDPVHKHCAELGFTNAPDSRIKIVQVPIYLTGDDGFLNLPYEAVLRAMDLSCFPSYYEPWGYTPQESLAVGVPTITTDYAGFGRWANGEGLAAKDGVTVLERVHVEYRPVVEKLAETLEQFLESGPAHQEIAQACRATAQRTAWSDLIQNYHEAYRVALDKVQERLESGVVQARRPRPLQVRPPQEGQRPRLFTYDVSATVPAELDGLRRLARNTWWCWDPEAPEVFQELSPVAWEASRHNPVRFLQQVYPEDLQTKAADKAYVAKLGRVLGRFDAYMAEPADQGEWCQGTLDHRITSERPVAYFCAEFGIHESLRIYSGGLGILAGDHLKSASDLNLPLIGVGLFYRFGYLSQRLTSSGEQVGVEVENEPTALPLEEVRDAGGKPLEVSLTLPGRELVLRAWRARVGRVTLYLLDSNVPCNRPEDREITKHLYGGGPETRLQQEIVLGRGGVRLLRALDVRPAVYHMNEGHAAFLTLERVGGLALREGLTFEEARSFVRGTTLFTTHTPVPAGHDRFSEDLVRRYFSDVESWVGVSWERFWSMGHAEDDKADFNMTYLALHYSSFCNGVSQMHGEASQELLQSYWPALLQSEVPVDSITNGIHLGTWTHPSIAQALVGNGTSSGGAVRASDFANAGKTKRAMSAVWKARGELKKRLVEKVAVTLRRSFLERSDSPTLLAKMLDGLRDDALYVGFARRFAPYKRAHLLFKDLERLGALLNDDERPLRILIAGKAHPNDQHGKDILQAIAKHTRSDALAGKVFFLENYNINLARYMVQGVDVWLNNPTRMLEASGTSGMKAAANGALNLSIGDGWWPEAYDGKNGWMIADDRVYDSQELQDEFDSAALYRLLEEEVVPSYFERDDKGRPNRWLERVGHDLATIPGQFNTDRMVSDYLHKAYAPLSVQRERLTEDRRANLKSIVAEEQRLRRSFEALEIASAEIPDLSHVRVGDPIEVRVAVRLGDLTPQDVSVELVTGHSSGERDLKTMVNVTLEPVETQDDGQTIFAGRHQVERSGHFSYGIRARIRPIEGGTGALMNLARWA